MMQKSLINTFVYGVMLIFLSVTPSAAKTKKIGLIYDAGEALNGEPGSLRLNGGHWESLFQNGR